MNRPSECLIRWILLVSLIGPVSEAHGDVLVEEDLAAWTNATSAKGRLTTIDFDLIQVAPGSVTIIDGTEFADLPGRPVLTPGPGSNLFVGDPTGNPDLVAVSPPNVFAAHDFTAFNPGGSVTITFEIPVVAFGAWFLDVETGETTGYDLDRDGIVDIGFRDPQGDRSQSFLGFISTPPITSFDIVLGSAPLNDGVGLDNIKYLAVPEPATLALLTFGIGALGVCCRRRRR